MAVNLLNGRVDGRSWSRGDDLSSSLGNLATELAVSRTKKLPWEKIFIGAGIVAVAGLAALAATNPDRRARRELRRRDDPRFAHDDWAGETREIPRETMKQLLQGRRA